MSFYASEQSKGLNNLSDVNIVTPVDGQAPVYNGTTQKWENKLVVTQAEQRRLGATNLAPNDATTQVVSSVTFSIDKTNSASNGIITLSGTASEAITLVLSKFKVPIGSYVLSSKADGSKARVTVEAYNGNTWKGLLASTVSSDDVSFNVDYSNYDTLWISVRIDNGTNVNGVVVKPMVSVTAGEYYPYAPTNRDLAYVPSMIKKNGAYNLCPNNLTTQVIQGATITVSSNGTFTIVRTEDNANAIVSTLNEITGLNGNHMICGCPSSGSYDELCLMLYDVTSSSYVNDRDDGDGFVYNFNSSHTYKVQLFVKAHKTIPTAITFKPMITTDLNATYSDYQPHAMTNRALTEELGFGAVGASLVDTYVDTSAGSSIALRKWGHVCMLMMQIKTTSSLALNTQQTIATIPSGYIPKYDMSDTTFDKGYDHTNENHDIEIDTNGTIKLTLRNTHSNARWVCAAMTYICE